MTYGSLLRRENGTNSMSVLQMICGIGGFEAWNNKKAVLLQGNCACYLPHPYSTWNFGMIPLEQVGILYQPVVKSLG